MQQTPLATIGKANAKQTPIDIVWTGNVLMIETTAEGHKRVTESLDVLRKFGMAEIKIEVRFANGPAEELKKAKVNWTVLPSELPVSAAPNYDGGPTMPSPFDRSFDNEKGPRPVRSQCVIEKISPMMFSILDDAAGAKLIDQFQANKRTNILRAPNLMVLNGQSGCVSDCSQTPFVVAVADGQPQIRIVHEGTTIQLRPVADAQGKLKLDFRVASSKIRSVETVNLSLVAKGQPAAVQVPEVEKMCVEGGIDLPWNKWLLLGGLERRGDRGNSSEVLFVMLRAEKVAPFHVPPMHERADGSGRHMIARESGFRE